MAQIKFFGLVLGEVAMLNSACLSSIASIPAHDAIHGVELIKTQNACTEFTTPDDSIQEICESWLEVIAENPTNQPQRYVRLRVNVSAPDGSLLNDQCLTGIDLVDLGEALRPGGRSPVQSTHLRRYYKYGSAEIIDVQWLGTQKPDLGIVYPESPAENCP
ncbi:MAG: hypothetical protein AAGF24_12435 [Cyanobacteria bacterium P01_H01_bin.121]